MIGIIVAAVVVVGGGWYLVSLGSSAPSSTGTSASNTTQGTQQPATTGTTSSGSGTIGALLAMGNVQCTVTTPNGSGTVYVSGGKMRGDFSMSSQGKTMNAYMINDGAYIYSWSDAAPQGMKMAVSASSAGSAATHGGVSNSTAVTYSCSPWGVDTTMFVPPTNITFMAMGATSY